MNTLQDLLEAKNALELALSRINQAIQRECGGVEGIQRYEKIIPLSADEAVFKGECPMGVIFSDGRRQDVSTWKRVFEVILKDCNRDPAKHAILLELRGKLRGRSRVLLGSEVTGMRSPLKIDNGLYAETHYDVTMLLNILKKRILEAVDYDYSGIKIVLVNS